ncbi:hypothetical protein [Paenibacillus cucumis (ex Kampfer et al. 2016)]|uniref:Uncharacterized protein n=1 Tax=Paenibacillus cucumis (ex Kampfer et al. 2016) TaxID=1776858 RepID=A0ABS7KM39_9BACL|nr:hypothetical protein [Paenibacillus cucumis (ex Kampfer et al. 2016)]MBY0205247.1 hypothetical protein [Paenibacillus cucumis (ex Kampfer et al. 2016)]
MPIPQIPPLNQDADLEQVKTYVIRLERTLNFLLENGLDSENMFEVGGWRVQNDTLASKDGDVGMTTSGSAATDIRLWAGSTDPNTAPWRVTKGGKMYTTGAVIQSSNGYPRVEMNPDENLFGAYASATNYLAVLALGSSMSPQLLFSAPSSNMFMFVSGSSAILGATSADIRISSNRNVYLSPGANVYDVITPFDQFKDSSTNQTLYSMLLGKASAGVSTGSSGSHNHGIAAGTQLMVSGGGTVTWQVAPTHTHTQI